MSQEDLILNLKAKLGAKLLQLFQKSPKRIYLEVAPENILEITRLLFQDMQARFQIATGQDTPEAIEILYHWAFDALGCVVSVRTKLDRSHPEIESCTQVCKATEWIEREMWELLGIQFHHHPDLRHLLLQDDWPAGQYPLRRDYRPSPAAEGQNHV